MIRIRGHRAIFRVIFRLFRVPVPDFPGLQFSVGKKPLFTPTPILTPFWLKKKKQKLPSYAGRYFLPKASEISAMASVDSVKFCQITKPLLADIVLLPAMAKKNDLIHLYLADRSEQTQIEFLIKKKNLKYRGTTASLPKFHNFETQKKKKKKQNCKTHFFIRH